MIPFKHTHIEGFVLGLRTDHYRQLAEHPTKKIDWLEIISENYMVEGGKPLFFLDKIRANYPMVMHGVSLSIGSTDPFDELYLQQLKNLANRIQPAWISDHLCWTGVNHRNMHDLLPMPYTQASLSHLRARIQYIQDYLQRPLVLENVSSYISYEADEMSEWEFIKELTLSTGCYLLLDVNNVYVSSVNHQFNPTQFIDAIPAQKVVQIHLAGHEVHENYIIDTHDHPISAPVYELYRYTLQKLGFKPTMIERDDHIPPLNELITELDQVRVIANHFSESTPCQH